MLQGWKTFLVALALTVFGAVEAFDFTAFLNADTAGYVTAGIGVVMFILRALTNTAVFTAKDKE